MKRTHTIIITITMILFFKGYSQNTPSEYSQLIREGWKLCLAKDFKASSKLYEKAFKLKKNVSLGNRYNASCIHALAGNTDIAFKQLFIVASELKWDDYNHLIHDSDLNILHTDKRWETLKRIVKQNKEAVNAHLDKKLVAVLDEIYYDDQSTRNEIRSKEEKYGRGSKEMNAFWQTILKKDSINLIKVTKILNEHGWPDKEQIGKRGTSTLFLVIQHANQDTQEKYLPIIEKAVTDNNLPKNQYAMFYDRLMLRRGEKQVYGTQLAMDNSSKKPYVLPLKDPKRVDERRAKMGLNSMQDNLNRWDLTWDVGAYIKALPAIEARERKLSQKNKK